MKFLLFILLSVSLFAIDLRAPNYKGKIKFIKQIELKARFGEFSFSEISDLAYNPKKKILYMISDKGILYKFKASFTPNNFTLIPKKAYYFKRKNGKRLRRWKRDTEGIALDNKGRLFVSKEGDPTITLFKEDGTKIKNLKLPKELKISRYKLRSGNKSLESLAYHPKYGLLTALEWPRKGTNLHYQTIYSLSGKKWHFYTEPYKKNGISEIEVMDDGNILVLERAYNGIFGRFVITLKKLYINDCNKNICRSEVLLSMDNTKGWGVENFEGLTRVGEKRYLMISDDNNNFFQKTLLIYFEIK